MPDATALPKSVSSEIAKSLPVPPPLKAAGVRLVFVDGPMTGKFPRRLDEEAGEAMQHVWAEPYSRTCQANRPDRGSAIRRRQDRRCDRVDSRIHLLHDRRISVPPRVSELGK